MQNFIKKINNNCLKETFFKTPTEFQLILQKFIVMLQQKGINLQLAVFTAASSSLLKMAYPKIIVIEIHLTKIPHNITERNKSKMIIFMIIFLYICTSALSWLS